MTSDKKGWGKKVRRGKPNKATTHNESRIPQHGLVVTRAADLSPQKPLRVWGGRFHRGKIAIVVGEQGVGKGQLAAFMAATVSTGGEWPGGHGNARRGSVVYVTAEDRGADTIRPRLEAAGADLRRIHIVENTIDDYGGQRPFNLVTDIPRLDKLLDGLSGPIIVIVDPLNACLASTDYVRFNPNSVSQVRALLHRIEDLAAKHKVAVVLITHFTKGRNGSALSRVTGSFAFVAAARSVFTVERRQDAPDQRVFAALKNNMSREAPPLAFRIEQRLTSRGILAPYAVFAAS
jgi:RecA-family ATPase